MECGAGLFYDVNTFASWASEGDIIRLPEYIFLSLAFFFHFPPSFILSTKIRIAWLAASFWGFSVSPFSYFCSLQRGICTYHDIPSALSIQIRRAMDGVFFLFCFTKQQRRLDGMDGWGPTRGPHGDDLLVKYRAHLGTTCNILYIYSLTYIFPVLVRNKNLRCSRVLCSWCWRWLWRGISSYSTGIDR